MPRNSWTSSCAPDYPNQELYTDAGHTRSMGPLSECVLSRRLRDIGQTIPQKVILMFFPSRVENPSFRLLRGLITARAPTVDHEWIELNAFATGRAGVCRSTLLLGIGPVELRAELATRSASHPLSYRKSLRKTLNFILDSIRS